MQLRFASAVLFIVLLAAAGCGTARVDRMEGLMGYARLDDMFSKQAA